MEVEFHNKPYQHCQSYKLISIFCRFSPENRSKINPYLFMPFGHAPRNCIGMRFALTEAKSTLAKVLLKFRLEKTAEKEVTSEPYFSARVSFQFVLIYSIC